MITIFTPTYNRAYILPKLYESLKRQTIKDFEWIIVDDGSTDNTEQIVEYWVNTEKEFCIVYKKQSNSGKHVAINTGVSMASFEWFFIVDSDDYITDDAIENIEKWILTDLDEQYAGVSGTKCFNNMKNVGQDIKFSSDYVDCKNNERSRYGLVGDKAEVYRTSILKKYPFPHFPGEKFLSECAVWDRIAIDGYKIRWFNHPLMVIEYLDDGLTSKINKLELENFSGYTYATNIRLKAYGGVEHYRLIAQYINKALHKNIGIKEIAKNINQNIMFIFVLSIVVKIKNKLYGDKVI